MNETPSTHKKKPIFRITRIKPSKTPKTYKVFAQLVQSPKTRQRAETRVIELNHTSFTESEEIDQKSIEEYYLITAFNKHSGISRKYFASQLGLLMQMSADFSLNLENYHNVYKTNKIRNDADREKIERKIIRGDKHNDKVKMSRKKRELNRYFDCMYLYVKETDHINRERLIEYLSSSCGAIKQMTGFN